MLYSMRPLFPINTQKKDRKQIKVINIVDVIRLDLTIPIADAVAAVWNLSEIKNPNSQHQQHQQNDYNKLKGKMSFDLDKSSKLCKHLNRFQITSWSIRRKHTKHKTLQHTHMK